MTDDYFEPAECDTCHKALELERWGRVTSDGRSGSYCSDACADADSHRFEDPPTLPTFPEQDITLAGRIPDDFVPKDDK